MGRHRENHPLGEPLATHPPIASYSTHYPQINTIGLRQAWIMALQLKCGYRRFDKAIPAPTEETTSREELERALVSLARRVAELEHEWS